MSRPFRAAFCCYDVFPARCAGLVCIALSGQWRRQYARRAKRWRPEQPYAASSEERPLHRARVVPGWYAMPFQGTGWRGAQREMLPGIIRPSPPEKKHSPPAFASDRRVPLLSAKPLRKGGACTELSPAKHTHRAAPRPRHPRLTAVPPLGTLRNCPGGAGHTSPRQRRGNRARPINKSWKGETQIPPRPARHPVLALCAYLALASPQAFPPHGYTLLPATPPCKGGTYQPTATPWEPGQTNE